jgi:predicted N-acetyltransferase YhbS
MVTYGTEAPAEAGAREALLDRVMGRGRLLKPSERLRRGRLPADGLSLGARDGRKLVGTVRLWNVKAGNAPALLLGPLAVGREAQGDGVGANLMRLALARAGDLGHGAIILVGDPEYYERFGFAAEPTSGLLMPAPVDRRRFLGLELEPKVLVRAGGLVTASGAPVSAGMAERLAA